MQLGSPRRLQIIYDTNMRMAQAAGEWARIQRTKATSPFLRYTAILDGRPGRCTAPGGHDPAGRPSLVGHALSPHGWRCRCSTIQLSQHDLNAMGWEVSPDRWTSRPSIPMSARRGYDRAHGYRPGFGYNPGQAALDGNAARALMGKLVDASPDMAAAQAASAKFVVPAMKRDLVDWISPRLDAPEAKEPIKTGERRVVGAIPDAVLDFFKSGRATAGGQAVELSSGAVTLSEDGSAIVRVQAQRRGLPRDHRRAWTPCVERSHNG